MSAAIAALTRADVADYLGTLLQIYIVLIFIRILMSWIPRMPYNQYLNAVLNFVREVTDPYLNLFRKFVPMVRIGPGALDLSPIVATFVLIIVGQILIGLVRGS
jgi:YggT family protein